MSASDSVNELPGLTEAQRRRAQELRTAIDALHAELRALLRKAGTPDTGINLQERGINENHAAELRARLKTFAEDWDRPEASIYDEAPPR